MLGWAARILAVSWAGFWLWLGVAGAVAEGQPVRGVVIQALRPGVAFCLVALIAWYRPRLGGALLVLTGIGAAALYGLYLGHPSFMTGPELLATMALPPVVCGVFLLSGRGQAS